MSHFIYCYAECRYVEFHHAECRHAQYHYAECRHAQCHHAECYYAKCRGAGLTTQLILPPVNDREKSFI